MIDTIFFDLGDTFRLIRKDEQYQYAAKKTICDCLGVDTDPVAFYKEVIEPRYDKYRAWALTYYCEAPEKELWTRWLAFDYPRELVEQNAAQMTYAYRKTKGERVVAPGAIQTVQELFARGYTLGIVSDLVGVGEVDEWLDQDHLRPYFKTVQQSSLCLIRKPHPAIYYYALAECGKRGENTAFVGDNLNRDIVGAKAAGLAMTVGMRHPGAKPQEVTDENRPDCFVSGFPELLNIFPEIKK